MMVQQKSLLRQRSFASTMAVMIVLVLLRVFSTSLYRTTFGYFPAMMIEVMASRTLLFDSSPPGYYEGLLGQDQFHRKRILLESDSIVPDAYRLRRNKPNSPGMTEWGTTYDPVNRFGYIGPDWSLEKKPDTRRIAVVGDSVTEGYLVNMNQGFVYLLANRMNDTMSREGSRQRFEFLNFSVQGYHLTQMMDVALEDVPQFHPDVEMIFLTERSVYSTWDTHLVSLVQSGVDLKYDFLREVATEGDVRRADDDAVLHGKFAPFRMYVIQQALSQMRTDAERHHTQVLVVLLPAVADADLGQRRFEGIPKLLMSMHIPFIDLSDTFTAILDRDRLRISRNDIHPNPRGHAMICDNLYRKLRANPVAWSTLLGTDTNGDHYPQSQR